MEKGLLIYKPESGEVCFLLQWSIENQFYPYDAIKSPILGKKGSIEFFIYLKLKKPNLNLDFNYRIKEILKVNPYME